MPSTAGSARLPPRRALGSDVVRVLALLLLSALALDAVIFWRIAQGREVAARGDIALALAQAAALRLGAGAGLETSSAEATLGSLVAGAPTDTFAAVATPSLELLAMAGPLPSVPGSGEGPPSLIEAADLREALGARHPIRGSAGAEPWFGHRGVAASAPILGPQGALLGAVRVVVPLGRSALGPLKDSSFPIAVATVLLTGALVAWSAWSLFRSRIVGPVAALAEGARTVAAGRLDVALPQGLANELGDVAEAFEGMVRSVEAHQRADAEKLRELQAMNEDLRRARQELVFAEKMATVGRLASGVAHEVGNPLASLIGFVELLQVDPQLNDDLLPRMRHELDRIHRIIRDLLDYARRPVAGAEGLTPVRVAAVAEAAATLVRVQRRFGALEIDLDLPADLPPVLADARRLQQVLLNLLVNGAEAMGGRGRLRLHASPLSTETLSIVIDDEGPGIEPAAAEQIWEPFFTTKDTGEGTGLGLSVSLGLVAEMGGGMRYEPAPGGGSRFVVTLRCAPP